MRSQEPRIERRLAAIFAADIARYSRLMSQDEVETLRALTRHREILDALIAEHGGRIANTAGDSVLAEFSSVIDAVQCALEAQAAVGMQNEDLPDERRLHFRIGVHVGDVMVRSGDLFGDGVNIAARLQALSEPGGVCVSAMAREHIRKVLPLAFRDLGPQKVKNMDELIRAYAVRARPASDVQSLAEPTDAQKQSRAPAANPPRRAGGLPRIAVLLPVTPDDAEYPILVDAFVRRLEQLGRIDGGNVTLHLRSSGSAPEAIRDRARELIELEPDVILAAGSASTGPLLQATETIPVVFTVVPDPVGAGFVESLRRPGGNATGLTSFKFTFGGKMA